MLPSSDDGQVEPLAALVAVFAVCVGLTLYFGVLDDHVPAETDRELSETAADVVVAESTSYGVFVPSIRERVRTAAPTERRLNVTVRAADRTWSAGPDRPAEFERAERRVPVRVAPGKVRPGRIEVAIWPAG